mgnify:CR=1 FL=1|jgi:hypothetical protein
MTRCPKCGSYAINDDPERVLCDKCWRDAEIERLRAWIARTAEDEHLNLKTCYHARRIQLEAKAILEGKQIPAAKAGGGE